MRVAVVVRRLSEQGGTERVTLALVRHLVQAGDEVTAWVLEAGEAVPGARVCRLPGPPVRGRVPRMARMAWGAQRVRTGEADVVAGMVRAPGFDLWRAGGGCHADWLDAANRRISVAERIDLRLDRQAAHTARQVVVNSELGRAGLVGRYGVPADRIALVRNGVDLERFAPVAHSRGRRVVFLGHGWHRKGLSTAITAIARVPGAHLDVWGHEPRPLRWQQQAEASGVADRVTFRGRCDDPSAMLPGYDAMVLPTRYDPLANACLEAMACGVPVVTSARNGAAELSPDPDLVVTDPTDADGSADALERCLHSVGASARSRAAAEQWPAAAASSRLRDLLLELAA